MLLLNISTNRKRTIMSIKFSSIVFLLLALFIAKLSIENFQTAQATENSREIASRVN